jgi:predicted Zn finger-like uncharacterized protein
MADTLVIICPQCQKKFRHKSELEGKKIKCQSCNHIFLVQGVPLDKPGSGPAKPGSQATQPEPAAKVNTRRWEDDDDDPNPYGVTELDIAPRCPHCANLMPADDAIICLHCGYNTLTREMGRVVKTIEHTAGERFVWLLPGLLCVAGMLLYINVDIFYCCSLPFIIEPGTWADDLFNAEASRLWIAVLPSLFALWALGYYAFKRLILNPVPPEKFKD